MRCVCNVLVSCICITSAFHARLAVWLQVPGDLPRGSRVLCLTFTFCSEMSGEVVTGRGVAFSLSCVPGRGSPLSWPSRDPEQYLRVHT